MNMKRKTIQCYIGFLCCLVCHSNEQITELNFVYTVGLLSTKAIAV